MKRKNIAFWIICFIFFWLYMNPLNAQAQETTGDITYFGDVTTSGNYQYKYDAQTDSIEIVGYIGKEETVVVPAYIDGKPVREISYFGDYYREVNKNYVTKEISISNGIERVGGFKNCKKLEKIYISDSVTELSEYAFSSCIELKEVCLSKGLIEIQEGAFHSCESLKKIEIPNSVVKIGAEAFCFCKNLSKVKLPKNLKVIARASFIGCKIKSIDIPKKVERIETKAFAANPLTRITVPSKMNYIGYSAFFGCTKLKMITFKGSKVTKINTNAFKNIHPKAVFDVPNKSIKKYKKLLKDSKSFKGRTLRVV